MQALNLEQTLLGAAALHFTGTLGARCGDGWHVVTGHGELQARLAVSCLVQPQPGDVVAVWAADGGEAFIVAVLERPAGAGVALRVQGDVDLHVSGGRLNVTADGGIGLDTEQELSLRGDTVSLTARKWRTVFGEWLCAGREIVTRARAIAVMAGTASSVVDRLIQRSRHSVREVEQLDVARCGQMDYRAEHTMSLRAKHTLVTAEGLVKADADQIHLG